MTKDDVLFGYRLQLFALAAERGVSQACRLMGVHRSTYYRWKAQVDRHGLEMLRPRERRRPQMPNQLSVMVEQRIVAFSLGHPGLGPRRIASALARPEWGGLLVSPNGVYKTLVRHGLSTRARRLGLVAGDRAPYEPPPARQSPSRTSTRAGLGSWSGSTAFSSAGCTAPPGRSGRSPPSTPTAPSPGPIWSCARRRGRPPPRPPALPTGSPASSGRPAGAWSESSAITAMSSAARPSGRSCPPALTTARSARDARRPTGTSSAFTAPSSKSAGARRSPASCRCALAGCGAPSPTTWTATTTTASTTGASPPDDDRPTSSTVPARWSRDEPNLSAHPGGCSA